MIRDEKNDHFLPSQKIGSRVIPKMFFNIIKPTNVTSTYQGTNQSHELMTLSNCVGRSLNGYRNLPEFSSKTLAAELRGEIEEFTEPTEFSSEEDEDFENDENEEEPERE
ncbi:hypothetical protein RF11_06732 [Thelohanellus kitauei]|uniref:Uncharacterized protein n=1 Tax=Thelohanellus kitauei TaxID=669202 RepID=A0A0C2MM46_THEKT|nr:hypothetical protein RF11_06732 [Thelohanellus kitauei]